MAAITPLQTRSLYRSILRESRRFGAYNYREYAKRRARDAFREHQNEHDAKVVEELYQTGVKNLQMMKRQSTISQMFQLENLVVETPAKH
ncbi:hypothetical protein KEM55_004555 [Ascosphaera atra]|nr:hypothetical protein KEM55_004555 [Ascosphaera atra]